MKQCFMREVNPNMKNSNNHFKDINVKEILSYLIEFIKNPVEKIQQLPSWNWSSLFFVQITFAITSGVIAGLIKFNFYRVAFGLLLMPIVSTLSSMLLATFLYYFFQFFERRTESYRKLFALVTLSLIPFYIFQIVSEYFKPISLIGFAFTSLLLVVGLNTHFGLERKKTYQLVAFLYVLVLVTWLTN